MEPNHWKPISINKFTDSLAFLNESPFTATDRMLVRHFRDDWGESNPWILAAAALCNLSVREGHTYLDLSRSDRRDLNMPRPWPSSTQWRDLVRNSSIARFDDEAKSSPLVLAANDALYLEKYFAYEQRLAELISRRCKTEIGSTESDPVLRAASRKFFVITGGPGTGKTTLALRYLNTVLDSWNNTRPPRFAAIAPTGKAAARLAESIASGVAGLKLGPERAKELLTIPCLTIHRLLGALPNRSSFRKDARHPIHFDTLVIDESSMIDLPLMLRLFEALPSECQVLILGDKDQLASVDVGSVLNDILDASEDSDSKLHQSIVRLTKTYRFSEDSGIYRACQLARNGDVAGFSDLIEEPLIDFRFSNLDEKSKRIPAKALKHSLERHARILAVESSLEALLLLNDSITLVPTRQGPFGSIEYNRQIEQKIRADLNLGPFETDSIHCRPIIVLENDYELELFNGDLGIVWIDDTTKLAHACFIGSDGAERRLRYSELPSHESAFALTIHKSQGSEFKETVTLFGPSASQSNTKELVYTAFSRAKESLIVYANRDALCESISRNASRATRLAELLK